METPGRTSPQVALAESQNIPQLDQQGGGDAQQTSKNASDAGSSSSSLCAGLNDFAAPVVEVVAPPAVKPTTTAEDQIKVGRQGGTVAAGAGVGAWGGGAGAGAEVPPERAVGPSARSGDTADSAAASVAGSADAEAEAEEESLALARRLMQEEAVASYTAAVGMLRNGSGGGGMAMEGVASEDMAAMQALLEEDENSPEAYAMAEDDSLDYDGMLELGSAIGDVRKERWRLRCKSVINALPRVSYTVEGFTGDDVKCLICQCEYAVGDDLRRLPCNHVFHTDCVDGWLELNEECPTCRRSISPA